MSHPISLSSPICCSSLPFSRKPAFLCNVLFFVHSLVLKYYHSCFFSSYSSLIILSSYFLLLFSFTSITSPTEGKKLCFKRNFLVNYFPHFVIQPLSCFFSYFFRFYHYRKIFENLLLPVTQKVSTSSAFTLSFSSG
jgi:hypothetical protein